jgi:hypothetical protein
MMHRLNRASVCLLFLTASLFVQTSASKVIQPPGPPPADAACSARLLANGTFYLSGQAGSPAKDFAEQISLIAVKK